MCVFENRYGNKKTQENPNVFSVNSIFIIDFATRIMNIVSNCENVKFSFVNIGIILITYLSKPRAFESFQRNLKINDRKLIAG